MLARATGAWEAAKGRSTAVPLLPLLGTLRFPYAVGLMFWLSRKRLVGSYLFLMATSRS
jgi:hypothetical protein